MPPSAGTGRRCSADLPPRVSGSARRESMSAKGSCTVSTSALRASWWWRSPNAHTPCSSGPSSAHRRQALSRTGAGPPRSVQRNHRRADRSSSRERLEVRGHRGRQAQHHALRHAGGASGGQPARRRIWKLVAHTRFGCISRRCTIRAPATSPTAPTRRWRKSLGWSGNGCTRGRWRSRIPPTDGASRSPVPYPADLQHALDVLRHHELVSDRAPVRVAVRRRRLCVVGHVSRRSSRC